MERVKEGVRREVAWIEGAEAARVGAAVLTVGACFARELSTADCLLEMVFTAIEACAPIDARWLVAADAVSVASGVALLE